MNELQPDTLKLIQDTAVKAAGVAIHEIGDTRHLIVSQAGQRETIEVPPKPRQHAVNTLDDLIAWASIGGDRALQPVIWHSERQVVLVTNDFDRRDRVVFALPYSRQFATLLMLEKEKPWFDQKQFIRMLRIELAADPMVISVFRNLNWKGSDNGASQVERGKESISREVLQSVQGTSDLPDEIRLAVPVYDAIGERGRYTVACAVEVDAVAQRFQLIPLPGELLTVVAVHQADIRKRLDQVFPTAQGQRECGIFQGRPE